MQKNSPATGRIRQPPGYRSGSRRVLSVLLHRSGIARTGGFFLHSQSMVPLPQPLRTRSLACRYWRSFVAPLLVSGPERGSTLSAAADRSSPLTWLGGVVMGKVLVHGSVIEVFCHIPHSRLWTQSQRRWFRPHRNHTHHRHQRSDCTVPRQVRRTHWRRTSTQRTTPKQRRSLPTRALSRGWECVGAGYIEDVEFYEDDCEVVCRHCESPTQQKRPGEKSINTRPPPIREGFGVFCTNLKCQAFGHELDEQEIRCITGHSPAASVVGVLFCSPFLSGRESARFPDDSFDFL